ncbi:hypothetical protein, partial [Salimicrobium jeotgali]|uniref:hypothetical protein n=1 Tax=Salimicrobium jeotgali TaxID=1230341 RepID=UPI00195B1AE7
GRSSAESEWYSPARTAQKKLAEKHGVSLQAETGAPVFFSAVTCQTDHSSIMVLKFHKKFNYLKNYHYNRSQTKEMSYNG